MSKTTQFSFQIIIFLSGLIFSSHALAGSSRGYVRTCDQHSPKTLHQKASQYRHIIHAASHKYGVNANLIKAVITAETCFRPRARSHKGAAGLMQLMPATARRWGVTNRYNVAQNIHGGTLYLSWLLNRYNGSVRHAVAAYNSGEGTVDKYGLKVPYRETQRYLRQVMNAYFKMNGGKAPEFMRAGGVIKTGLKKSVRASAKQFQSVQKAVEKAMARDKSRKSRRKSKLRKSKRLLPSCLTASKKLHRSTYHRDKGKKRSFYYKVKNGDSLGKVMRKTGKSTVSIKRYNNIRRNLIRPGQKLKVAECRL
ncbi:MAG: transglycosylase SLT domain-containing protein [Thiolinea sp.]